MLQRLIFILLLTGFVQNGWGQKVLQKEWDALGVESVRIVSDDVFTIEVTAVKTNKIRIYTRVEGETHENVVLEIDRDRTAIGITTAYAPHFTRIDDKLAAHKVLAIDMIVEVPRGISVVIESSIASVRATGVFEQLDISLENGNCDVLNFEGHAVLHTKKGYIAVRAHAGVGASAMSRRGVVVNELPERGRFQLKAESIDGNITLQRTE